MARRTASRPMPSPRRILVTSALPYANGPIHLGHLVEYLQTDIWVRFQRSRDVECSYVCADDAHGTPIMLLARERGISPERLIEEIGRQHRADFSDFLIEFDQYHSTHSEENRQLARSVFQTLSEAGHIRRKTISRYFDPSAGMFLSDRYLRGTCPRCGAEEQYGDACERCGATYDSSELVNPRSTLSDAPPELRETEHLFFRLGDFAETLRSWAERGGVQPEIKNKLDEWFEAGLRDWDISRDAPYFGFEIPDAPGQYFYVWLDAPIGYMASHLRLCRERGLDFDDYWRADSETELYHFIGKDIAYFHTLFWPALLRGAGYRLPTAVWCHGFLTINGEKMSKSTGTFIEARAYLRHLDPEHLRYYFATKLSPAISDINLNLDDFVARVNSDLIGKVVNIASRCAGFIEKRFGGRLAKRLPDPALFSEFAAAADGLAERYETRSFSQAMREIMALADRANQYVTRQKPWETARAEATRERAWEACTQGINLFRTLIVYLKPVLPTLAAKSEAFLDSGPLDWEACQTPLLDRPIRPFAPLSTRIDPKDVRAMVEETKAASAPPRPEAARPDSIPYEDFAKIDLRVARIEEAREIKGADRLLALTLDLGDGRRQVIAGIRSSYAPERLLGRLVVAVANLEPRRMRFGTSEGMILAAGDNEGIWLLSPDEGARPGMKIR